MGSCASKNKNRGNVPLSIDSVFNIKHKPNGARGSRSAREPTTLYKSDFYFFIEWILSFRFYIKLYNDDQNTRLITMLNGPNDKNIIKVIKAIDQIDGKDLSDFSSSISLQSKINSSKQSKQSFISKQFTNSNNSVPALPPQLSDEELKIIVQNFFEKLCKNNPKKMKKLLFQGPPNNLRWLMWLSVAKTRYLEIESSIGINNGQIFEYLINTSFLDEETETKIKKDLLRTKNDLKYFKGGNWSISLYNVLKAIALYDDKLGYCIGMNEIAASALIVSDCNEVESFNLLRFLYSSEYGLKLREFYINGFPKLKFYTFFVNELIKERIPKVFRILNDKQILNNEMWLQNWLQNLYSNLFEFSVGVRLWDCIISLGTDFLINFSLGYIKYFEEQIIGCGDETEFLEIFKKNSKFKNNKEIIEFREKIIKLSLEFNISLQTYQRIQEKYNASVETEQRTSVINKPASGFRHSITRKQINVLHIDKKIITSTTNDEANKMRLILKNLNLPIEQRQSIITSRNKDENNENNDIKEEAKDDSSNNNDDKHDKNSNKSSEHQQNENNNDKHSHSDTNDKQENLSQKDKKDVSENKNIKDELKNKTNKSGKKVIFINIDEQDNELKEDPKEQEESVNNDDDDDDDNIINQNEDNEEENEDIDESIIENYSNDDASIIKGDINNKVIDPNILMKLSQLNMNVKEEQCPKGMKPNKQNI